MVFKADTHVHTVASTHAFSTVLENATYAKKAGLELLAITDHTPGGPDSPHIWHFHNLRKALPREIDGVTLLFGAEANIMDSEGHLDFSEKEQKNAEWVIASIHRSVGSIRTDTPSDVNSAYLAICENPYVDVIGHCANEFFRFDYERIIPEFGKAGKLVEINESSIMYKEGAAENYLEILRICKEHRVPVIVNSDSHFCMNVGQFSNAEKLLEQTEFPEELVVNTDRQRIVSIVKNKRGTL